MSSVQPSPSGVEVRSYAFATPDRLELHPNYAYLRRHEPLSRVRMPFGEDAWLAVRYDDARTVLGDARFGRALAVNHDEPRLTEAVVGRGGISDQDPPEHTRLRRLVAKAFTARRTEQLRPRAQQITANLLDRMVEQGPPADLVRSLAQPLPGTIICELLGVPTDERARFQGWADAFMSLTALTREQKLAHLGELSAYLAKLIAARRETPANDLLGALVTARDEHDRLSEQELISLAITLFAAGYETTGSQIANFTYLLLTGPEHLELVRSQPELMPDAIEELLRYVPLTDNLALPRYASEDVELSAGTVRAGEPVFVHTATANRDPEVFADADRIDLTRSPNPHLAFGHGAHHCVGAQLARMELQVAMSMLLHRLPGLRLGANADELTWKSGLAIRGPVSLPVTW